MKSIYCLLFSIIIAHISSAHIPASDTIPDLTEQTKTKEVLRLPNGRSIEVEMYKEETASIDPVEAVSRRASSLSCISPSFTGKMRKYAKTVPHLARAQSFDSCGALLETLASDSIMKFRLPPIDRGPASRRVEEEERNVILKKVWLMAIYREDDNDYHLILCDKQFYDGETALFSAEVAGLPEDSLVSDRTLHRLEIARQAITRQFGDIGCGRTFIFKNGGLPVKIRGSLFFDIHHAGHKHGRQGLYPKSAWEIHPVTLLKFLPE